ncbi:MAG: hypothetical protein IH822_12065 [Chloroflexi bacterium]|nr:hypothetical protein [Chloroflexota bacterium]
METIVVALVVGAVGGLFGSIAGPWLAHRLSRERRKEEREEERNRELRRMVEHVMRLARSVSSSTLEIEYYDTFGRDIQEVLQSGRQYILSLQALYPDFIWRPHRIHDPRLRTLSDALNSAVGQLGILISVRRGELAGSIADWPEQTRNVRRWLDILEEAVDRQMDKLGW